MKAAVIVFPGSNCDRDVKVALTQSMGREPIMVWHKDADFEPVDLMVLPGGFSYGDYLRCGAMAAHSPVMTEVVRRARDGVPTLGICNGFQVLTEAGLLPGVLMRNAELRFVCRDVLIRVETSQSLFTARYETGQVLRIPVAHHDGNYEADPDTFERLEDREQIAFRYCERDGTPSAAANPNGSMANIAGVYNEAKTVLGLMPHPERLSDPQLGGNDGRPMFDGLVEALS
ncbi:MAG: phosphoribosylformylglycinamidine synthase subunit PurQ [Kiloniellales bacterium]|nr:phosphoribosylformylglycinamidine synthase subunit PurQ [Kiloniellales bacterium]MDJ0969240.1 phosphoribosylformylglycinamidine synthase subunit PurQ [Kiloniellales bacterium]MDJ0982352.1 phosphoribosylformylglycinamidine synthase subunit PurQ [Kiloniellales bacterium]